jgi:tetratricopeptide (TPR) repeat protein
MRAEALSALVISADDAFFQSVADCLRWAGSETISRVRTGKAASAELASKRFFYSAVVIHVEEDVYYDVEFIQSLVHGRDASFRSMPVVAIASVKSRQFYAELAGMGLTAVVPAPINRVLLRNTLFKIFRDLQLEYRNPDPRALRRALANGDVEFVEERCIRALQHQPQNPTLCSYLGEVYFRQSKFERALEQANSAIRGATQELPLDAIRLKAKTLHKMGKSDLAFAVVPQLIKSDGRERSAIGGMISVLNSYAGQLKASGKIEEALVYYNLALAEPEATEYRAQLGLNIALAYLAANKLRGAYMAASQSLAASGGKSRKARELIAYIEKNHPPEAFGPEPLQEVRKPLGQPGKAPAPSAVSDAFGLDEFDGLSPGRGDLEAPSQAEIDMGPEDIAALEAELTEEVDLPSASASASGDAPVNKNPASNDVFAAMKMLGAEESIEMQQNPGAFNDSFDGEVTLDSFGDSLGVSGQESADDFDFAVSDTDLAAARQERVPAAQREGGGSPSKSPSPAASELDSALFLALENQNFDSAADALIQDASNELLGDFGELAADPVGFAPEIPAPVRPAPKAVAQPPAVDALKKQAPPAAKPPVVAKPPAAADLKAKKDNPAEPPKDDEADSAAAGDRINWRTMTEESLLAYVMFEKEYPRIKVKPQKMQPRKRVQANFDEFE